MPKRGAFALLLTAGALAFLISFRTPDTASASRPGRVAISTAAPDAPAATAAPRMTSPARTPSPSGRPGRGGGLGGPGDGGFPPDGGFGGGDDSGLGGGSQPGATATPRPTQRATTGALKDGTYTGESVQIRWGNVQVQVTVSGGKVTDVTTLDMPYSDRRTQRITDTVEPVLREQALSTASADLDMVSGATYTCRAYAQSMQSALDKAAGG
jgi:uncharacterized protein with FMN-binding domain